MTRKCLLADCDSVYFCKGYCRKHFERWRRHGDPNFVLLKMCKKGEPRKWIKEHANFQGDVCLIWPFARHPDGRAQGSGGTRPPRLMCEAAHGPAPSPFHEAAHSCGKGHEACMNPKHLRWATPLENASDKFIHGTVIAGEKHYGAKLTEDKIRQIRALSGKIGQKEIAEMFGVKIVCVNKVINRKTWKHVL